MRLIWTIWLLLGLAAPAFADEGPVEVEYPSRWGLVTFQHQAHQTRVADCMECHHQGVEMGGCSSCHGVIPAIPQAKDVLHKRCKDCHRARRGPTECAGCHDPERLDEAVYEER